MVIKETLFLFTSFGVIWNRCIRWVRHVWKPVWQRLIWTDSNKAEGHTIWKIGHLKLKFLSDRI